MKIFTVYYDRYETATTSLELSKAGYEHIVLCHSNKDLFTCIGDTGTLVETKQPKGIQHNYNYGLSMLEEGEWGIFLSDDLTKARRYDGKDFIDCDINHPLEEIKKVIDKMDKSGVKLIGLNAVGNSFYVKPDKKYSQFGLVDGRCFAIKKTDFRFHNDISTIPDYWATAYHLEHYKKNIIINHTFIDFKRYGKGGLGSINERIESKKQDVALISHLLPNRVEVRDKPGQPEGSHIVIKR